VQEGLALDLELQAEVVRQGDGRGADEARVAVARAHVRQVERPDLLALADALSARDRAVADDLDAGADALPRGARHGCGEGDVAAGAEQAERHRLRLARGEGADPVDGE